MTARISVGDLSSDQRRMAMDMAKQAVGVALVPDENLTPLALFLMSAVAPECCARAFRHVPGTMTPPDETPFAPEGGS